MCVTLESLTVHKGVCALAALQRVPFPAAIAVEQLGDWACSCSWGDAAADPSSEQVATRRAGGSCEGAVRGRAAHVRVPGGLTVCSRRNLPGARA